MRAALVVIACLAGEARADVSPFTHTTALSPTGHLVPAGRFEYVQSVTVFHHDLAYGITDGFEARMATPVVPLPLMGGDLQLRASVLPASSPFKAVVGAGVLAEWINGFDAWPQASATVAYAAGRWNVHATARIARHAGADGGERALWNNVGVSWRAGDVTTLFLEVGQLAWTELDGACPDKHGGLRPCEGRSAIDGVAIGAWWELPRLDVGLTGVLAHHEDLVLPVLPLLSIRHQR